MTPQPVSIHGRPCLLTTGGDRMNPYVVTLRGVVLATAAARFLAIAKAAEVLRTRPQ